MKTKIIFYALTVLLTVSCHQDTQRDEPIDLLTVPVEIKEDVLDISRIADSIRYIPLSNDLLLRDVKTLKVDRHGAFYITDSKGDGVFKFDKEGRFVRQISSRGQGVEEYFRISDIDLYQDTVYLNTGGNTLLYFDLEGKYLQRKTLKSNTEFSAVSGDTIYSSTGRSFTTLIGDKENTLTFNSPDCYLGASHRTHFTRNGSQIYWEDQFTDTLYTLKNGTLSPYLHVDFKELALPKDIKINDDIFMNPKVDRYCTDAQEFRISDDYITFMFGLAKSVRTCIYDRKKGISCAFQYLKNDIDGFPLIPIVLAVSGKKLYSVTSSSFVAAQYAALKNSEKEEDKRTAGNIEKLLGKVPDEMDNPVLVEIMCR